MRVIIVTTWFPDSERPSAAPFVVAHARAIALRNDVEIVHARLGCRGPVRMDRFGGLPVTRIPLDPRHPAEFGAALARLRAFCSDADIVHTMAFSSIGVLAPIYPLVARKWVHTEHWSGVEFPERVSPGWHRVALARHMLRLPRRVSAVSTNFADVVGRFARDDAVDVIPNVVESTAGAVQPPAGEILRIVAVGGLVPGKQPLLAVDTLASLAAAGVDATLDWVGDGPLREATMRRARQRGVADRIHLSGSVPHERVFDHLDRSDIFFLPTQFETFLVAGAEALARGRPVVLPSGGPYEDFVDESVGLLVSDQSANGFADAIRSARNRFCGTSVDRFRAAVLPRYGEEHVGKCFDIFYGKALR